MCAWAEFTVLIHFTVNRFASMRLEDMQGETPSLCKGQHGCRYLQKKLEEDVPEHRDMIFRETFGHFPELMTGKWKRGSSVTAQRTNKVCRPLRQLLVSEASRVLHR